MLTHDWRSLLAKKPKDRKASSWIAPNGDWYNCPFADHSIFAAYVLQDEYSDKVPYEKSISGNGFSEHIDYRKCGDILAWKCGWLLVHYDIAFGCIITGSKNMTVDQYAVLYEYWKDTRLFRGWTVRKLWENSVNYKEGM